MINKNIYTRIATLGLPIDTKAPGTVASLYVAFLFLFVYLYEGSFYNWFDGLRYDHISAFGPLLVTLFALFIVQKSIKHFKEKDPSIIVIDEVAGMFVTMCMISMTPLNIFLGFLLFRFFDILKPLGIKKVEKIGGPLGIVLDDVVAGLFANLGLQLFLKFI
jgi:phosphatidylglycerophosphatase A